MRFPFRLALRHLLDKKIRNGLTVAAISVAVFLLCFLIAIVQGLEASVRSASATRLVTQSAVSLFVSLPISYQHKIDSIDGVYLSTKFRWFGAYYQDQENFFAQFAVDPNRFLDMYTKDIEIIEGPGGITGPEAKAAVQKAFDSDRRAAIIGIGLRDDERYDASRHAAEERRDDAHDQRRLLVDLDGSHRHCRRCGEPTARGLVAKPAPAGRRCSTARGLTEPAATRGLVAKPAPTSAAKGITHVGGAYATQAAFSC